ncbi:MAG: retroviral-like aspartic protease family protein [Sphingomicrobium sp.]
MKMTQSAKFLIAFALAAPAAAEPAITVVDAVQAPVDVDRTTTTQDIAFKLDRSDRMTVPVRLGGKGPYRFLVDTGADRTAVSTAIAAQLGLVDGPIATLHSITGTSPVRTANIPSLEISPTRTRSVEAPLLEAAYMGADGILGVDSLRSQRVMFDFRSRIISIVPSAQRQERDEEGTIVVRGNLRRGHLIVTKAKVNGLPMTVILDTGSEISLGNPALRAKLEARRKLGPGERIAMTSVTGQKLLGDAFRMKSVKIGDVEMKDLIILFADAAIFRTLDMETRPAVLLGMNAMQAFNKISIDFARKQLRLVVPQQSSIDGWRMASR